MYNCVRGQEQIWEQKKKCWYIISAFEIYVENFNEEHNDIRNYGGEWLIPCLSRFES